MGYGWRLVWMGWVGPGARPGGGGFQGRFGQWRGAQGVARRPPPPAWSGGVPLARQPGCRVPGAGASPRARGGGMKPGTEN